MFAPRSASWIVSGTSTSTFSPLRAKIGESCTCVTTKRSPLGPPLTPGSPLPARRIFERARGNVDAVALDGALATLALARRAELLDDRARAAALRARLGDREQPLALGLDPAALAARADDRRGAGLRARAVAGAAALEGRHRDRDLGALDRLLEADRDLRLEVAAALGARAWRGAGRR